MTTQIKRPLGLAAAAALLTALSATGSLADSAGVTFSQGNQFTQKDGADLYASLCQACHMDKGQGAIGAGKYPALAKNENLESAGYPITVVLHGQKAMPPVGEMLSDEQVAAVVNYVRTHFGNDYKDDPATAADVKDAR